MADRKRLVTDLRVIDLRGELEKRNLDKSGVRGVLIQRLSKHLEEEGHDPATYNFELEIKSPESKTPAKRTRRIESAADGDAEPEGTPAMEDMIVQDDVGDEDESEQQNSEDTKPNQNQKMEVEESEKANRKRELKDSTETSPAKKPCLTNKEKSEEEEKAIENNTDAEDSINLDLGEDELLNEETDTTSKVKKDEGADGAASAARKEDSSKGGSEATADSATADSQQEVKSDAPATSNGTDEKANKDQKDDKEKDESGEKKDKDKDGKEGGARNLWVSGLSGDTRAKDLKQLCSKHGKVIGAKVVTNARTPGSRCYGYVTMASAADAENCIKNLHRTELHGRMISVEKAKSESESAARRQPQARAKDTSRDRAKEHNSSKEEIKEGSGEEKVKKEGEGEEELRATSRTRDKSARSDKDKGRRSTRSRERRRSPREVLSVSKIWKERDMARARERSRAAREEERRRRAAEDALRERERRQRVEKHRLALEREKLRAEREKIEREKNELLRLERERHRLEREKLELERLELKRAQLRLEEERRKRYEGGSGNSTYRSNNKASSPPQAAYERDPRHKPQSRVGAGFEAPPPPRFELPKPAYERERDAYKRDYPSRHISSSGVKYGGPGGADEARQPLPPGTRKDTRGGAYERGVYRPSPPSKEQPRASWASAPRYTDAPNNKGSSSGGGGASESWAGSGSGDYSYPRSSYQQYQPPPPAAYPDRYNYRK